jgi:hypothetical protein
MAGPQFKAVCGAAPSAGGLAADRILREGANDRKWWKADIAASGTSCHLSSMVRVVRNKLPKGWAYPLKASALDGAIAKAGVETPVTLFLHHGSLCTAKDMAVLSRYLIDHHPDRYGSFGRHSIRWKGWVRPNHNRLLGKVKGLDGIKTGYTVQGGFNLAASAERGWRRVIVVVMGNRTAAVREGLVTKLLESELAPAVVVHAGSKGRLGMDFSSEC